MAALAIRTHYDDLLGVVAPLAVAMSQATALVVDLDRDGIPLPGTRTLADLVADGPTLSELVPTRAGLACLPNGGIDADTAEPVLSALVAAWPHVVVRVRQDLERLPTVHVIPALPRIQRRATNTIWVRTGVGVGAIDGPVVRGPSTVG